MRLIVHAGLHKTASTHLQHVLHAHRDPMAERGVLYQRDDDFAAHHRIAWALLADATRPLELMLDEARARGCHTAILSSEDLEGVLFAPAIAERVAETAARAGASVEWHFVLREPGAYFASLFAQLQWHVYSDALTMFAEIMNKGGLYMHDPAPHWGGTPFWFYAFDHLRYLEAFAAVAGLPFVHDYADDRPYPGWRLLDRCDVLDLVASLPAEAGRNRRHPDDQVLAGYRARIAEAGGAALAGHVEAAVRLGMAAVPDCAALIGERFAASHAAALERFGRR